MNESKLNQYQKTTELTKPPIVGEHYLVPCVKAYTANWADDWSEDEGTDGTVPVLGDFHDDKEIINFPEEHIHIDFRFISSREFKYLNAAGLIFGKVVSKKYITFQGYEYLNWEVRRCNRRMPPFPHQNPELHWTWMPWLEDAYKDKQLTCDRCPHRGMDLRSIPRDRQGNRTCPGHGLTWDKKGALVAKTLIFTS